MFYKLKNLREKHGFHTASALSRVSGVNIDIICKMEKGITGLNPTTRTYARLARALGMDVIELMRELIEGEDIL